MRHKPGSAAVDLAAEQLAKAAGNPALAERERRRQYGDLLDRVGVREGVANGVAAILLAVGFVFAFVGANFAWNAGQVIWPDAPVLGGLAAVVNDLGFILFVFCFDETQRPAMKNRWTLPVAATFLLSLFCIYTSQTQAAERVRLQVEKTRGIEASIAKLAATIDGTVIQARRPAELGLERAQDEAVGWGFNTISQAEAKRMCAGEKEFEAAMECRQKVLRASVDCTQDIPMEARDAACDPIKLYETRLAQIDEAEANLAADTLKRDGLKAELAAQPKASNVFIESISRVTGWELQDAQARIYIALGLVFLLIPAIIFAWTLELRPVVSRERET
jgi:hypothetical protein